MLLPDVDLTCDDTHGALYACAYDLAVGNESPWCDVFYEDELAAFEYGILKAVILQHWHNVSKFRYEMDLIMDASIGYLTGNNAGRILGSVFVNKLIERYVLILV
jgi:acid phosphatase